MADSTAKSEELKDCRVGSPYHQKCVPPYCDTAQTDRFVVAKLQRDELEDRYIVVTNENVSLKRLMNELRKQVQRLNTQAQRQERIDKREGKVIPHCDDDFINNLQQQNRTLQAKVNVLTQQLQNHSRMHARVHGAANAKEAAISPTRNRIELTPEKDLKPIPEENNKEFLGRSEIEQLKYRIRELEQELKGQREVYERRISELEAESSTSFQRNRESAGNDVDRVMDNVEIIRLRRLNKRQAAQIITLSNHNDAVEKELGPLRKTVENLNKESEELMQRLQKEKQKLQTVQHQAAQSQSLSQAVKALEEQVLDLQKERVALQEHNEKLLSLTSQHSENELNLKKQVELLEWKMSHMGSEEKDSNKSKPTADVADIVHLLDLDWKKKLIEPEQKSENKHKSAVVLKTSESAKTLSEDVEIISLKQSIISLKNSLKDSNDLKRDLKEQILERECNCNRNSNSEEVAYLKEKVKTLEEELNKAHGTNNTFYTSNAVERECNCTWNSNSEEVVYLKEKLKSMEEELNKPQSTNNTFYTCNAIEIKNKRSKEFSSSEEVISISHRKLQLLSTESSTSGKSSTSSSRKCNCNRNSNSEEVAYLKEKVKTLEEELNKAHGTNDTFYTSNAIEVADALREGHESSDGLENKLESALHEIVTLRKLLKDAKSRIRNSICKCNKGCLTQEILTRNEGTSISENKMQMDNTKENPLESKPKKEPKRCFPCKGKDKKPKAKEPTQLETKHNLPVMEETSDAAKLITTPTQQGIDINSRTAELVKREIQDIKIDTNTVEPKPIKKKDIKVDVKPVHVQKNTKKKRELIGMKCPKRTSIKSARRNSPVLPQESTNITAEQVIHNNKDLSIRRSNEIINKKEIRSDLIDQHCPCNTTVVSQQNCVDPLQRIPKSEMRSQDNIIEPENHHQSEDMNHNVGITTSFKIAPRSCCHCERSSFNTIMPPEQPSIEYLEPIKMATVVNTSMTVSSGVLQSVSSRENFNSTPLPQDDQHKMTVAASKSGKLKDEKSKKKIHHGKKSHMKRTFISHSVIALQSKTIISQTVDKSDGGSFEICIIGVKVDNISFKNLMKFDMDPQIYITWKFLGVEKKTTPIKPLRKVDFTNCVVYYGLISQPILQCACKHCINIVCYLLRSDGSSMYIADGELNLSTTLAKPGVMVYRYIDLIGNDVQIELYCSFRLIYPSHLQIPTLNQELPERQDEELLPPTQPIANPPTSIPVTVSPASEKIQLEQNNLCRCLDKEEKKKHKHKHKIHENIITADSEFEDQKNLVIKIETLKLNKNSEVMCDENVSQLYVDYSFLGLCGQDLETKTLPKDHIMNFHHTKKFTDEIYNNKKNRDKLKKMLQPDSCQVLRFVVVSEPPKDVEDIRECVELGFAEVNLYTSMFLKNKNLRKEKLPVFSMDGKSNIGTIVVSVFGIELMKEFIDRSGSD